MKIVIEGTVGSTAYGLAREGSDIDTLGVFVAPTRSVAGLEWHSSDETRVTTGPDSTYHEIGKFLRLALKCNPTITELLWLPDVRAVDSECGGRLLSVRRYLLSRRYVRDAYIGYAHQQIERLKRREDGTFSSDTRNRTVKHGRHMLRLLRQGAELLETGKLTVRVPDPEEYWAFDNYTVDEMIKIYERERSRTETAYENSVLSDAPDLSIVSYELTEIRRRHFDF